MKFRKFRTNPAAKLMYPIELMSLLNRRPIPKQIKKENSNELTSFDEMFYEKKKKNTKEDSFHRAMSNILTAGQCFGILPVSGIRKSNYIHLKFIWFSWTVIYTLLSIFCSGFLTIMCFLRIISSELGAIKGTNVSTMVFYCSCTLELILFLLLAKRWPSLIATISHKERSKRITNSSLRSRFNWCCFVILFAALIEYVLSFLYGLTTAYDCYFDENIVESYYIKSYPQIFEFTNYELWKGIILQINNLVLSFNWSFMDLFLIVVSLGLTDRFNQINRCLEIFDGNEMEENYWKSLREEYASLSRLVKIVDSAINKLVLLTFTNNLVFICVQLFNSFDAEDEADKRLCDSKAGPIKKITAIVYFGFSFGFIMIRFLGVSLSAARIHSAARQPAYHLYAVPSSNYGIEVRRFLEQVVSDNIALTGMNFFDVTRGLVLTIAGTIVTYELVLVQFDEDPPTITGNIKFNKTCGISIFA